MAINLTDSLNAATTKGKLGDAKQVYLNGDTKNLQQAYEETSTHFGTLDNRSTQMEKAIQDISVTGGASTANAISYNNSTSKLEAITAQGAIDELAAKKFDKESILQESGEAEDKVMSQKAVSDKLSDISTVLNKVIKDSLKYETGSHNILDIYCSNVTNIAVKIKFKEISKTGNYGIGIYNPAKNKFIASIDNIVGADIIKASLGEVSADTNHLILQINVAENSSVTFTDGMIEVIKYPQDSDYTLCETNDLLRGFDKGTTQSEFNSKILGATLSMFDVSKISTQTTGVIKLGDIYGIFKKGEKIIVRNSNIKISYTGGVALAIYNGKSLHPDLSANNEKINQEFIFGEVSEDTDHLVLQVNVAENSSITFTDGTIEVIKYPQYSNCVLCETNDSLRGFDNSDTQSDFNSKIIGAAASVFDLSTINSPNAGVIKLGDIYGVFKTGQKIGLRTSKIDLSLTGNVAIGLYNGSSRNPDVAINRDKIKVEDTYLGEVSADTNHLILQINVSENSSVTFTDGVIEVIKYPQEVIELDKVSKQSNTLQSLVNAQNIFSEVPYGLTQWIWARDKDIVYIGLSYESFEKDTCLRKIGLKFYEGNDYSYDGKTFDFLIGHIDQRNWFLPDKRISSTCIKKKYGSDDMFYFEFDDVIIKSGQTLVLEFPFVLNDGKAHAAVGLSKDSYKENSKIFYTYSLKQSVTIDREYGFSYLYFDAVSLDSVFSTKSQVSEIKTEISDINNYLSRSGVLIDRKTLERYRIQISNGVIQAKKIDYKKGLALGNSYTRHGKADNLWFAYRAMAASVDELQWHQLVGRKIGATFTAMGAVRFESECDPDRDLEAYFNSLGLSDEYDVIIVQLGENIREKDETRIYKTFFNLLKYMLGAFSKADIYLMLGEPYNYVSTQIINVASALGLTVIDCRGLLVNKSTVNYRLGDYVQNDTGGYDYISVEGVSSGHPSDLGQVIMANKVLDAFLCDNITNMTYNVKLNQTTGGTISSSFSPRVAGGVVSIKCEPESGYSIGNLQFSDSSINAIKKTNTYGEYYVFIMPEKDIEITPEWVVQ